MATPYEILGVDTDASREELKRAYRRQIKRAHPDNGGSVDEFQAVHDAYETLTAGDDVPSPEHETPADDPDESHPHTDTGGAKSNSSSGSGRESQTTNRSQSSRGGGSRGAGRRSETNQAGQTNTPGSSPSSSSSTTTSDPEPARIEYLNYETLKDRGWELSAEDLFERASKAQIDPLDHGKFLVEPGETLLEGAEARGFAWPYACRGGACANCAVAVCEGELSTPTNHVLPDELTDRGIRLSCGGKPLTPELQVVFNVKHLAELEELRLLPTPFERSRADD